MRGKTCQRYPLYHGARAAVPHSLHPRSTPWSTHNRLTDAGSPLYILWSTYLGNEYPKTGICVTATLQEQVHA